jgi:P63C domain
MMRPMETKKPDSNLSALNASRGGHARASVLTPEQRSTIAREAVRARWIKAGKLKDIQPEPKKKRTGRQVSPPAAPTLPFSMFRGKVHFGNLELDCHVLNDDRRVFTQGEMVHAITGGTESSNLARYLGANPLISDDLSGGPIRFQIPGNPQIAIGSEATLLIEICERYLDAHDQGLLRQSQQKLAKNAAIIVRACAKLGIIGLIDEATGYQKVRARNALQIKLQAFIADDLQDWAVMFPEEFWIELARLEGVHYSPRNRPLRWGKYVMLFVYDAIDGDVGKELRKKNPNPHFLQNHHQWLKKFGRDKVHDQIERVITIMKLCNQMDDFREKFARVFKKSPVQLSFADFDWNIAPSADQPS